jgi:hypothetical protein
MVDATDLPLTLQYDLLYYHVCMPLTDWFVGIKEFWEKVYESFDLNHDEELDFRGTNPLI